MNPEQMKLLQEADIYSLILNFIIYASAIAAVVEVIVRMAPKFFKEDVWGQRIIHGLPIIMGALGSLYPGTIPEVLPGPKPLYGILAGTFSGQVYAWLKRQFDIAKEMAAKEVATGMSKVVTDKLSGEVQERLGKVVDGVLTSAESLALPSEKKELTPGTSEVALSLDEEDKPKPEGGS